MTAKRYGGVDCCGSPWLILLGRIVCCVEQGAPLGQCSRSYPYERCEDAMLMMMMMMMMVIVVLVAD
ncbi:hypothetical protein T4E_9976 [Trichinella pseudospiralis]|uniref:Uncharacterized protein n=1 Tax=Trichinella pseudospiralis TaxID=6337 RepID=A0A0V0YJB9_TRIPS|nr:hypothetical protein T4E_9976 [Trichinella pseudospiralis]